MPPRLVICAFLAAAGCANDLTNELPDAAAGVGDATPCPVGATFFVNPNGGSYEPGPDDPIDNLAMVLPQPATLNPAGLTPTDWQVVMSCVADLFAAFNIAIVDADPLPAPHHEVVVTGDPSTAIGLPGGISGIAPLACAATAETMSFVFTTVNGGASTVRAVCDDIATNILRSAGVENVFACESLPGYETGCGDRTIVDDDLPCGNFMVEDCGCGGTTINPHQKMVDAYGTACGQ